MKINPLNENILSMNINDTYNIFFVYGNNFGLVDVCYSDLKKKLEIDLRDPFTTSYFDENRLLNNTETFFDELYSISLFNRKKTLIVDTREGDKKKDISNFFNKLDFSKIQENQILIISYMFKQADPFPKKILKSRNAITFACYEENDYKVKSKLENELIKANLKLSDSQIHKLINRLSKDTKIIQNTFEKIRLNNKNDNINYDQLLNLIDDNNDRTMYEMINKLMIGNYNDSINLLKNFEQLNVSSISILYVLKSKIKLLKKYFDMRKKGIEKKDILNFLNIFYSEQSIFLKMVDLWNLNKIDVCLYNLFKTELNCKSKKEHEYLFLSQFFLFMYFKIKS